MLLRVTSKFKRHLPLSDVECTGSHLLNSDELSIDGEQPFWETELIRKGIRVREGHKRHTEIALLCTVVTHFQLSRPAGELFKRGKTAGQWRCICVEYQALYVVHLCSDKLRTKYRRTASG